MRRKRALAVIQAAVSLALLGLAVWIARPSALVEELTRASIGWLAFSLLFVPVLLGMRALRWHILARTRRQEWPLARSFHSYMGGLVLAIITPFAAGELARGALAAPDDRAGFVGLTLLDKLLDVTALVLVAAAGFAAVAPQGWKWLGAVVGLATLAGWLAAPAVVGVLERRMGGSRLARAGRRAFEAARGVGGGTLAACFVVAVANFALLYCHLYVIMYAFARDIELGAVGLFPLITLSRVIPSIAGLGVREFTAGALFARAEYQVSSAGAVAASFTQFMTLNVVPAALWVVLSGGFAKLLAKSGEES